MAQRDSRLTVIENPGGIVSCGLNAALAVSRGSIIIRMDAHTVYAENYINECIAVLKHTGADNVGGPALTVGESYVQRAISAAYQSPFAVGGARFHNVSYEGPVDTVPYGCWPRTVFLKIGFFDEDLVRNQDDEFNLRLVRSGGKIWQSPRIKSWYRTRGSIRELFIQYLQYGYWKVRVIQKHKLPASIRHLVPAGFLLSLGGLVLVSLWSPIAKVAALGAALTYATAVLSASIVTAYRNDCKLLPILMVVFPTYHLSYGLGFLRGVWDFMIVRRRPAGWLATLSRSSATQKAS